MEHFHEKCTLFSFAEKMQPADVNISLHLQLYSAEGYETIAIIGWMYPNNPFIERLEMQSSIRIFFNVAPKENRD